MCCRATGRSAPKANRSAPVSSPCSSRTIPAQLSCGPTQTQESRHPALDVLILGGRPIGEPIAWQGPFVMNNRAELAQAFDDYHAGKLGVIPG